MDGAFIAVTNYGVYCLIVIVILMWWQRGQRVERRNTCIVAALSFLMSLAFNQALLLFIHRVRPYDAGVSQLLIAANADWSFPSDHATAVSAIVAGFWFRGFHRAAGFLLIAALIVCFSRVYVGAHYVSDVMGGVAIGILSSFVISRCYKNDSWYARNLVRLL